MDLVIKNMSLPVVFLKLQTWANGSKPWSPDGTVVLQKKEWLVKVDVYSPKYDHFIGFDPSPNMYCILNIHFVIQMLF